MSVNISNVWTRHCCGLFYCRHSFYTLDERKKSMRKTSDLHTQKQLNYPPKLCWKTFSQSMQNVLHLCANVWTKTALWERRPWPRPMQHLHSPRWSHFQVEKSFFRMRCVYELEDVTWKQHGWRLCLAACSVERRRVAAISQGDMNMKGRVLYHPEGVQFA